MKDEWRMRYVEASHPESKNVLTGFNVNIDCIYRLSEIDVDLTDVVPRKMDKVESPEELNQLLKYCKENRENIEIRGRHMAREFHGADKKIGGQAGIISNFLSKTGHYTGLYTPFLSEEITGQLEEDIVYPEVDGGLKLKRVGDAVNTDRTKTNLIVELDDGKNCRLIVSDRLQGFGPYFRAGVADRLKALENEFDGFIFSGFHDADGNFEAKMDKAEVQLDAIERPKHLEYVGMDMDLSEKMMSDIVPLFDSIGLDESEAIQTGEILGKSFEEELSLGEAFQVARELIEEKHLERVHIHTYRYHVTVLNKCDDPERVREGMLYAEKSAVTMADSGRLPDSDDVNDFSFSDDMHLHRLDDLEHFRHHLELEEFTASGITEVDGLTVVAVPTIIHEDAERVVGMGDIISSGAFTYTL